MIRNEKMRDALKEVEATVTATLAHQPEDDEKCSQFLYDALVKVYNIADLACHEARDKCAAPAVNGAKLREALKKCLLYIACAESVGIGTIILNDKVKLDPKKIIKSAKEALAEPARNCDVLSAQEQAKRGEKFCSEHHKKWIGGKIPTGPCECPCYEGNSCNYFLWAQMPYACEATPCSE